MNKTDFVYTLNKDGTVQSGGYTINSILMANQDSLSELKNVECTQKQIGGNNLDKSIFENLGVPAGLVTMNGGGDNCGINRGKIIEQNPISDSLYLKLFEYH